MPVPLLITGKPMPFVRALAERHFEIRTEPGPGIRAVASCGGADAALIAALPDLEIVAHFGVGYDPVDVAAAAARGVVVTNTPDVLTDEVADTTLGLLVMTVRELSAAERWLRAGRWESEGPYPITRGSLRGRKAGILGLGRIGRAIATRLEAFGLSVAYHSRNRVPDVGYDYHGSAESLAAAVDTLIVVAPGGAATRHMVDARVLDALGPEGVLVSVGRGSVVDEAALVDALASGRILAAGLDVYEDEPRVHPGLLTLDRVVLLPHVASASVATREAMGRLQIDNLLAWFDGRRPLTPVAETPVPAR